MEYWAQLLIEHDHLRSILKKLEDFTLEKENIDLEKLSRTLKNLDILWNTHEKEEEEFFKRLSSYKDKFSSEKMLIEEHKELKGHWKVLQISLKKEDKKEIFITLDTDGRMLIQKFKDHMAKEENIIKESLN